MRCIVTVKDGIKMFLEFIQIMKKSDYLIKPIVDPDDESELHITWATKIKTVINNYIQWCIWLRIKTDHRTYIKVFSTTDSDPDIA